MASSRLHQSPGHCNWASPGHWAAGGRQRHHCTSAPTYLTGNQAAQGEAKADVDACQDAQQRFAEEAVAHTLSSCDTQEGNVTAALGLDTLLGRGNVGAPDWQP